MSFSLQRWTCSVPEEEEEKKKEEGEEEVTEIQSALSSPP